MANYKISTLTAYPNSTFGDTDKFEVSYYSGGIHYSRYLTGAQLKATIPSGITVGTTPISSGTTRRVFFQDGTVVSQSANLVFDASSQLVIGGHTGGAKLDVKAGGALSTDIAFRVRNSANTLNILEVRGDGNAVFTGDTTSNRFLFGDGFLISGGSNVARYGGTALIKHRFTNNGTTAYFEIDPANGLISTNEGMNYLFGTTTGTKIGTATTQKLSFWNATPIVQPTTSIASATLASLGGTALTDTDTFDGYTLKQIVKALRNSGLLQ